MASSRHMEHSMAERLKQLEAFKAEARVAGGEIAIERHRAKGRMTARERLEYLLDEDSFQELDMLNASRRLGHGSRGVASLHRRRHHRLRQDRRTKGLRLLPGLHRLRWRTRRDARREDPQDHGPRDHDGPTDHRAQRRGRRAHPRGRRRTQRATAASFERNVRASGVVPQISVILGPCAGGGGVLTGADGLHLHGEGLESHVHHRTRRREVGDRRGRDARRARRRADSRDEVRRGELRASR